MHREFYCVKTAIFPVSAVNVGKMIFVCSARWQIAVLSPGNQNVEIREGGRRRVTGLIRGARMLKALSNIMIKGGCRGLDLSRVEIRCLKKG